MINDVNWLDRGSGVKSPGGSLLVLPGPFSYIHLNV